MWLSFESNCLVDPKEKPLGSIAPLKGLNRRVDLNKCVFINHLSYGRQLSLGQVTLIIY